MLKISPITKVEMGALRRLLRVCGFIISMQSGIYSANSNANKT